MNSEPSRDFKPETHIGEQMRQKQYVQTQVLIQPEEDETMGQSISGLKSGSNFLPDIRFTQEVGTMLLIIQNMTIA